MEYNDPDYLNLFTQIQTQKVETTNYTLEQLRGNATSLNNNQMIRETPNYTADYGRFRDYNDPNINEVKRTNYSQDLNLNEFNIETRINGQSVNEVRNMEKEAKLNEVMEHMRQERLNEIKRAQEAEERQSLNETVNFSNLDVVTLEMFDKARYNSMMQVATRITPK